MTYIRFENHDCIAEAQKHREDDVNISMAMVCSQAHRSTAHSSPPLCSCVDGDVSSSSSGVFPHVTTEMGSGWGAGRSLGAWTNLSPLYAHLFLDIEIKKHSGFDIKQ